MGQDKRLKYVDMSQQFHNRSNEIRLQAKMSNRACEALAKYLVTQNPNDKKDFDRVEKIKEYVLKTSALNDEMISLIDYIQGLLMEIGEDSKVLIEGAVLRDTLSFQSETIEHFMNKQNQDVKEIYDLRKHQINSK